MHGRAYSISVLCNDYFAQKLATSDTFSDKRISGDQQVLWPAYIIELLVTRDAALPHVLLAASFPPKHASAHAIAYFRLGSGGVICKQSKLIC